MARKNLSSGEGTSRKIEIRVPDQLRAAIESVLRDGEKISAFARTAFESEIKRRKPKS